jgi:hypothetical protein
MTEGSRCQAHPDQSALGTCTRCGVFFCDQDRRLVDDKPYCATCAVRPDVDYVESFRLKHWGKRDEWAWLVGLGGVVELLSGVLLLVGGLHRDRLSALFLLGAGVVGVCFWRGLPWARPAFLGVHVLILGLLLMTVGPGGLALGVIILLVAIAIHDDARNKLFFKKELSREKLRKAWHLYMNNGMARAGVLLAVLGLAFPGVGLIALVCSIIGLRRVDPHAHPPIGRKWQAIAGLVLGAGSSLFWGGMLAYNFLR